MTTLAAKLVAAAATSDPAAVKPIYTAAQTLEEKITAVATTVYGAAGVLFKPAAKSRLAKLAALGYGTLPVCIAKTQYSFTDDPKQMGAPSGWTLTVSDVSLSAGAGFVVAIAGSMMLMPGLGKVPQAQKLDVDDQGARDRHGLLIQGSGIRDQGSEIAVDSGRARSSSVVKAEGERRRFPAACLPALDEDR